MPTPTGTTGHEGEKALIGQKSGKKYYKDDVEITKDIYEKDGSYTQKDQYGATMRVEREGYTSKDAYKVVKFSNSQWIATDETATRDQKDMKYYADMSSLPTYVEGGSKEWGAANISKEDFLDDNGNPLTIEQVYSNLDPKFPNKTGDPLKEIIKDLMPKYQKVSEKEKGFLATERGFAEKEAKMGRQADLYGLQKGAGQLGAQMRGAYGGMGGGMRGAMAGGAQMGKQFGVAQDVYGLAGEKAAFAEEKGLYGLEKRAGEAYETDIAGALQSEWFETPESGAQVTAFARGGRVPKMGETFLDILAQLPEAGGS